MKAAGVDLRGAIRAHGTGDLWGPARGGAHSGTGDLWPADREHTARQGTWTETWETLWCDSSTQRDRGPADRDCD